MKINQHFLALKKSYLFSDIAKRAALFQSTHPDASLISLGIGDVTLPLAPVIVDAMQRAAAEMGEAQSFRGYGDEQGYLFLRQAICTYYASKQVLLSPEEVFISDGAKSDLGNILDIFSTDNTVLIPNPVYPVYVDTNVMAGRRIQYMQGTAENGFLPMPDWHSKADIIYLCSPNNPTGAVYTREQLREWIAYAIAQQAVILFDRAYEGFVQDQTLPASIYELKGASSCAIEVCSLSKTAGFTGTRCGYTIIPQELIREQTSLQALWMRRQATKFNGVSYIVQRGAEAAFSVEGQQQIKAQLQVYMENAKLITQTLQALGIWYTGGHHSPYVWIRCPHQMSSWEYFQELLQRCHILTTPGAGFGSNGEGYLRLSAFAQRRDVEEAMRRLREDAGIRQQ